MSFHGLLVVLFATVIVGLFGCVCLSHSIACDTACTPKEPLCVMFDDVAGGYKILWMGDNCHMWIPVEEPVSVGENAQ